MPLRPAPDRRSSRPGVRRVLTVGLLAVLVGAVVLAAATLGSGGGLPRPPAAATAGGAAPTPAVPSGAVATGGSGVRAAVPARRLATLVVPEAPRRVRLPNGRTVTVAAVSTLRDGTLAVPEDIAMAGWWRGGSRVGDPFGSMLVAAHIDSRTQGLGPFAQLLSVRPRQTLRVSSRHLQQDFRVRSRRLVPQGSLADQRWMFAPSGDPRLTLVTCAPPFDASRGGYQNLAVVTADPVGPPVEVPAAAR